MLLIEIIDDSAEDRFALDGFQRGDCLIRRLRNTSESLVARRSEVDRLIAIFMHESYSASGLSYWEVAESCDAEDVALFRFTGGSAPNRGSLYSLRVVRRSLPDVMEVLKNCDTKPSARFVRAVIADVLVGQGRVAVEVLSACAGVLMTPALQEQRAPGSAAEPRRVLTNEALQDLVGLENLGAALGSVLRHPHFGLTFEECELASTDPMNVLDSVIGARQTVACGADHLVLTSCIARRNLFWLIKCAFDSREEFDLRRYWAGIADVRALLQ